MSSGGCAKAGTDIADLAESRADQYLEWLGEDVCKVKGKMNMKKCCYREFGDETIYQYRANHYYSCNIGTKNRLARDKFEFRVPTAERQL